MPARMFRVPFARPSPYDVRRAIRLDFSQHSGSLAAGLLVDAAIDRVMSWEASEKPRQRKRSSVQAATLWRCAASFLGGILRTWSRNGRMVFCSSNKADFNGTKIPARQFLFLSDALIQSGLLARWAVFRRGRDPSGWLASRFWPTPRLLQMATDAGVTPDTVATDFPKEVAPEDQLSLPRVRRHISLMRVGPDNETVGRRMPFDASSPIALRLRDEVIRQNEFGATFMLEGCARPQWSRTYNGAWELGGRWYSRGPNGRHYQAMAERDRIALIRINGEQVAELDMKACYLTLTHGALGLPAPPEPDPYVIDGHEAAREAVKAWINCTIGKGSPIQRWPDAHRRKMAALGYPSPSSIEPLVTKRYPFLREGLWRVARDYGGLGIHPRYLVIHRLTAIEAQIVTDVMYALRKVGTLVLPMHDGVIVPASVADDAHRLLLEAGRRIGKVELRLTIERSASVDCTAEAA